MKRHYSLISIFLISISCQNSAGNKPPDAADTLAAKMAEIKSRPENYNSFTAILQRKKKEGIDFYAVGQEPGWTLDLDFEKEFIFSSYDGTRLKALSVPSDDQGNLSIYRVSSDDGEMIVQVSSGECADVMSGQKFTHSVTVIIKTAAATEAKIFKGCGDMLK